MSNCLVCGGVDRVGERLNLGPQPLCNRFLPYASADEQLFALRLGQCDSCGVIQLLELVPPQELRPRVDWISYREAEGHLDDLVAQLTSLWAGRVASVGAISSKDDSTVDRFRSQGFSAWRLTSEELGIEGGGCGPETIQAALTPERARALAARGRRADIVLARHVLEHAHAPLNFVEALLELTEPGGLVVFEVPDCSPGLHRNDYTVLWEDHVVYFTPALFDQALHCWGLRPVWSHTYPYSHENSIVRVVSKPSLRQPAQPDQRVTSEATHLAAVYAGSFASLKFQTRARLRALRDGGPVALFGAGHLSCTWINLMEVQSELDCVVDDDPNKRGLFMPGSRLPILPSSALLERGIRSCLLSLNQESEAKVVAARKEFVDRGGRFFTVFPGRPNSVVNEVPV